MILKEVTKKEILPRVFHLDFPKQELAADTFLRFQEYYESPKFHGKIFSLEEYKDWYIKEKGAFTYVSDWPGFNIPSSALKPFYEGKFDPLSENEKEFLNIFKNEKEPFYIIGTAKDNPPEYFDHEIAHALFHINKDYKKEVIDILMTLDKEHLIEVKKFVNLSPGYHESVLIDEVQAHLIANFDELIQDGLDREKYISIYEKLKRVFAFYEGKQSDS